MIRILNSFASANRMYMRIKHESLFVRVFSIWFACILSACSNNDIIYDYEPVVLTLKVQNAEGENLLSSSTAGNILNLAISVTYQGKNYPLQPFDETGRFWPGFWRGIILVDGHHLEIGEFDGNLNYVECILHIGSRSFPIRYSSKNNGKRTFYFDGERCDGPDFVLRL